MGNYPKEDVKKMLTENLRGEINPLIKFEKDFLEGKR